MARKSTPKGEATRERILDAAADLFHADGINATSVGDVLRAADVGKGQFYQHFASRAELQQRVLERHREFIEARRPEGIASWAELRRFFEEHAEAQAHCQYRRGCPVGTAAYALQGDQADARRVLRGAFGAMRREIAAFLAHEKRSRRYATHADPQELADFAIASIQGGMLLSLLETSPKPARHAFAHALAHIESFRRPREP